jgi:toxin ParE1/3/4
MILTEHYSADAKQNIKEIIAYYDDYSDTVGDRFQEAIDKTVQTLCRSPEIGTLCSFDNPKYFGTRILTITKPFNKYLIFFRQEGNTLQILRIIYGSRDYETLFES